MIKLKNVTKSYLEDQSVLSNVNLEIKQGDFIVLKGQSGGGKTTLLNIVSFIDTSYDGEIFFESEKMSNTHRSAQIRRYEIGYIFQDFKLIDEYTIRQNLEIILSLINIRQKGLIIEKTFLRLNLPLSYLDQYPNQVSGGEKQRIALARALIKNPKIIIGDEVTGSLDRHHASTIIKILQELNDEGITIIIATHDKSLFNVGNRLITVRDGQIYED